MMSIESSRGSLLWLTSVFVVVLSLAACRQDDTHDTEAPVIEILYTTPEVTLAEVCEINGVSVIAIPVDSAFRIGIKFTDDKALGSAKLDIHNNFDCHTHRGGNVIWEVLDIRDLEGTEVVLDLRFATPDDVRPGNYHFEVMCIDAVGQEAIPYYFDVVVFDPVDTEPPVIDVMNPPAGAEHPRSELLNVAGTITDNMDMGLGEVEITLIDASGASFTVDRIGFAENAGAEVSFSTDYFIPGVIESGSAELRLSAYDWRNNTSVFYRSFVIVD